MIHQPIHRNLQGKVRHAPRTVIVSLPSLTPLRGYGRIFTVWALRATGGNVLLFHLAGAALSAGSARPNPKRAAMLPQKLLGPPCPLEHLHPLVDQGAEYLDIVQILDPVGMPLRQPGVFLDGAP